MTSDLIASSLARPPAFRIMWASPSQPGRVLRWIQTGIHAREDGELTRWWHGKAPSLAELVRVRVIGSKHFG